MTQSRMKVKIRGKGKTHEIYLHPLWRWQLMTWWVRAFQLCLLCCREAEITDTPDRTPQPKVCRSQFINHGIYSKNKPPDYTAPMQPTGMCNCIGTATGYCVSCRHGI